MAWATTKCFDGLPEQTFLLSRISQNGCCFWGEANLPARIWNRVQAALALEARTESELANIAFPPPHEYFSQTRLYLQRTTDTGRTRNGVHLLSRHSAGNGDTQINAGPTIFREPCDNCIKFKSGAQLSFGVTLGLDGARTTLLAYRFYLSLLPASGLKFVRIDLNARKADYDPLQMPRCHIHPGFENVHIPFPVMSPIEVLDRIVHVIEPHFSK